MPHTDASQAGLGAVLYQWSDGTHSPECLRRGVFPWSCHKKEVLVSLLNQTRAVRRPGELLQDVDPQEFEAGHTLRCCTLLNGCVLVFLPKPVMSSLVLLVLSSRLFSLTSQPGGPPPPCRPGMSKVQPGGQMRSNFHRSSASVIKLIICGSYAPLTTV